MKSPHFVFSILFLCLVQLAHGLQVSVRPLERQLKPYPKEGKYTFEEGTRWPIVHKTDSDYYIHVKSGHDMVLHLDNTDSSLPARADGEFLEFWEDYKVESDRAYLFFSPERWFRVISETDQNYKIEYSLGETKLHCSIDKEGFEQAKHILGPGGELLDRKVEDAKDAICLIKFQGGAAGSGFLLYQDDKLYCYTNQHVAMGLGRMTISLIDGTRLESGSIEIAEDSDLARIEILTERPGFMSIAPAKLQEPVKVLGNSLGAGRVTILKGKVTGLNDKEVETSAKFVSGNSGSPILNEENEVLGVATLLEMFPDHDSILKGSGFEEGRRVGMRLDREIEWLEVDIGRFISRNRLMLQAMEFIEELPQAMIVAVSSDLSQKVAMTEFRDPTIRQWLRARAHSLRSVIQRHQPAIDKAVAIHGNAYYYSPQFAEKQKVYLQDAVKSSQKNWHSLSQKVNMKKRTLSGMTPYPDSSYMHENIDRSVETLEEAARIIDIIKDTHTEFENLQRQ